MRDDLARTLRPGSPVPTLPGVAVSPAPGWIVVVEHDVQQVQALREILASEGHRLQAVDATHGLGHRLLRAPVDLVFVDLQGGGKVPGLELLERLKRQHPTIEVVMLTDRANVRAAVACMDSGAFDYLEKPLLDPHRARATARKAIEHRRLRERTRELERRLGMGVPSPERVARSDEWLSERSDPAGLRAPVDSAALPVPDVPRLSLAAYERAALVRAMAEAGGDASRAAALLGIGRSTLYRKLARHRMSSAEKMLSAQGTSAF